MPGQIEDASGERVGRSAQLDGFSGAIYKRGILRGSQEKICQGSS